MDVEKAIIGRRSVRGYHDKPVPEGLVAKLLKAGAMAPSAMDKQPCRFIVITDRKKIRELSEKVKAKAVALGFGERLAARMKEMDDAFFYGAPLLIIIVAEKGDFAETDCALAAQNMMLQGYELGLGSCFIGFANMLADDKETMRSLGLRDGQRPYCPLIFGYPKEWPKPKDREAKTQDSP